jgi:dTDP-3-amino-3,4,6-trideoxy-alpha-D-glucose transaminase
VLSAVNRVGESGWLILGDEVRAFESDLANYCGSTEAVGTANGLDALEIALRCVGIKPGDVVLTTPLSAFATTLAIVRIGAHPHFVDVDQSGLLDLDRVEHVLKSASKNAPISAVVPVHLYGHAMDVERLQRLARQYEVTVIEDCAQAIGARSAGLAVGSASPVWPTSFYPTKNLGAMGDAGALLTSDAQIAKRARALRDYGSTAKYVHDELGMNSRLDELQAAILRSALLPRLRADTQRRRQIAAMYSEGLRHRSVQLVKRPEASESVWHLFALLVHGSRTSLQKHLQTCHVQSAVHYPSLISEQGALKGVAGVRSLDALTRAREFASCELSIPIHPWLTDSDVHRVIDAVNSWTE